MRFQNSLVACLLFALTVLPPASASLIDSYSDFIQWANATAPDLSTINFSTAPAGSVPGNITVTGVQFNPLFGDDDNSAVDANSQWRPDSEGGNLLVYDSGSTQPFLFMSLPAMPDGVTSLGINLATFDPNATSFTVTIDGADQSVTTETISASEIPTDGFAFFGGTFDARITSVQITAQDASGNFSDNLAFGTLDDAGGDPSPTPEAGSLLTIGSGLMGMRLARVCLAVVHRRRGPGARGHRCDS